MPDLKIAREKGRGLGKRISKKGDTNSFLGLGDAFYCVWSGGFIGK